MLHTWAQLPDPYPWPPTHNVAVDREEMHYLIPKGRENSKDHAVICGFAREGKFVRALGILFKGGGHELKVQVARAGAQGWTQVVCRSDKGAG